MTLIVKPEILDELLKDYKTPGDVDTLYSQLLQRVINRSLEAEMGVHPVAGKLGQHHSVLPVSARDSHTSIANFISTYPDT